MEDPEFKVLLWDKNLETGVSWIDTQHRQLLERIENLVMAIAKQTGENKVRELVSFLGIYVHNHFNTEQNYMQRFNFPQTAAHLAQHNQFVEKFKQKEKKYLQNGPSRKLASEIANDLWGWYKDHICIYDKKLGVFLKVRKAMAKRAHKLPEKKDIQPGQDPL